MKFVSGFLKRLTLGLAALIFAAFPLINALPAFADTSDSLWVTGQDPTLVVDENSASPQDWTFTERPCVPTVFRYKAPTSGGGETDATSQECAVHTPYGVLSPTFLLLPNATYAGPLRVANSFGNLLLKSQGDTLAYSVAAPSGGAYFFLYDNTEGLFSKSSFAVNNYKWFYSTTRDYDYSLKDASNNLVAIKAVGFSTNGEWMIAQTSNRIIRLNLITHQVMAFEALSSFNGQFLHFAVSDDGRYAAVSNTVFGSPTFKMYDLSTCVPNANPFAVAAGCSSQSIMPSISTNQLGATAPHVMVFASDSTSISARITVGGVPKTISLYASGHSLEQLDYLALGDSFQSGEGDRDGLAHYLPGTDGDGPPHQALNTEREKCHISDRSYPYLLAQQLGIPSGKFRSVACSGAVIEDIHTNRQVYAGQFGQLKFEHLNLPTIEEIRQDAVQNFIPGRTTQIEFVRKYKPKVITVGISGNDVGFPSIIEECILSPDCDYASDPLLRANKASEIGAQFFRLRNLYKALHEASPGSKIYAVGYPQFVALGQCDNNVHLETPERHLIINGVAYLNQVVQSAAQSVGVGYLDIDDSLAGGELCSGAQQDLAVNGATQGDDKFISIAGVTLGIGQESMHPNDRGHGLVATKILSDQPNLLNNNYCASGHTVCPNTGIVAPPAPPPALVAGSSLLGVAVSNIEWWGDTFDGWVEVAGNVTDIILNSDAQPLSPVDITLRSDPIDLGTVIADTNGRITASPTLPPDTPAGYHTLHFTGTSIAGNAFDMYVPLKVVGLEGDRDNDGILDEEDACMFILPVGEDVDQDGLDDACDGDLNTPPSDTEPPIVTGAPDRSPDANGWYTDDVTINWLVADPSPSSGEPTQPAPTVVSVEGEHEYQSAESCDPLDQCATGSLTLKIDKTEPEITFGLSSEPTAAGWHNQAVTVTFTCADATSGIDNCSDPETVSGPDGGYVVTGTATDNAGRSTSVNVFVSLDSTNPTVTNAVAPAANSASWHNSDVTITPTCADSLSGLLNCSEPTVLSTEGSSQAVTHTATDNAGNSATSTTHVSIDKTAPTLGSPTWSNNPKPVSGLASIQVAVHEELSGLAEAEYFLGDIDPGLGNGATMQVGEDMASVGFNTDFPTGVYKVTVRARDAAGNWSIGASDYLVVYNPEGTSMTGKKTLLPSLEAGDILPGLISGAQNQRAKFGFNVRYDDQGNIHPHSDFQFSYSTGDQCNKPAQAVNCHDFELNATSVAWLATQGTNHSTGIFQGSARLELDGATSQVTFRLTGLDGARLDQTSDDHLTLKVYAQGDDPNTAAPIYQVSADVLRGNIRIRTE